MTHKKLSNGVVHTVPKDLGKVLTANVKVQTAWENITPLARNEWICWVENAKKLETRIHRIKRAGAELVEGKRRPCCWMGCNHRVDKNSDNN